MQPHSPVSPGISTGLTPQICSAGLAGGAGPDSPAAAPGPCGAPDHGAGHGPPLVPGAAPLPLGFWQGTPRFAVCCRGFALPTERPTKSSVSPLLKEELPYRMETSVWQPARLRSAQIGSTDSAACCTSASPADRDTAPSQTDLADGALELNDTLLAAVGADYAASGDLQVCGQSGGFNLCSQCKEVKCQQSMWLWLAAVPPALSLHRAQVIDGSRAQCKASEQPSVRSQPLLM